MLDVERFVEECQMALEEHSPGQAIREIVERAISDPSGVEGALGTPDSARIETIHRSDTLTILNVIWAPGMSIYPHDHRMWAVIGIYGGQEDNTFYRRGHRGVSEAGGKVLRVKDAIPLGRDVIHSVRNPLTRFTGAIHVYGGDFFTVPRSEFDLETLEERPYDSKKTEELFRQANEALDRD